MEEEEEEVKVGSVNVQLGKGKPQRYR